MKKVIFIFNLLVLGTNLQAQTTQWQKVYSPEMPSVTTTRGFDFFQAKDIVVGGGDPIPVETNIVFINEDMQGGCFPTPQVSYFNSVKLADGTPTMSKVSFSHDSVNVTIAAMKPTPYAQSFSDQEYVLAGKKIINFYDYNNTNDSNLIQIVNQEGTIIWKHTRPELIINQISEYTTYVKDVTNGYNNDGLTSGPQYVAVGHAFGSTTSPVPVAPFVWKVVGQNNLNIPTGTVIEKILHSAGNGNYHTYPEAIITLNNGDYAIVGKRFAINSNGNPTELYIARLDNNMDIIWEKGFPYSNENTATKVLETAAGELVLTGTNTREYSSTNGNDLFILKLNAQGNTIWQKNYTPLNTMGMANDIIATADGGYLLAGQIDSMFFDPINNYSYSSRSVAILVKTDAGGNEQWSKIYLPDTVYGTGFLNVKRAPSGGGYVAVGNAYSNWAFGGIIPPPVTNNGTGNADAAAPIRSNAPMTYVVRTDAQGNAATAGMKEITILPLAVYPNPTTDVLNVSLSSIKTKLTHYQLYSNDGKLVISNKIDNNTGNLTLSISHLAAGNYQLIIPTGNTYYRASIVKN